MLQLSLGPKATERLAHGPDPQGSICQQHLCSTLSHKELFELLVESVPGGIEEPEPEGPATESKKGKAPAKKRSTRKKRKLSASTSSVAQLNVELLSALSDIRSLLISMNNCLVVLESNAAGPASTSTSSSLEPTMFSAECSTLPWRTLGTAVPAPTSGAPFLSPAGAIPDAHRNQIIGGMQLRSCYFFKIYCFMLALQN